jgi:hypothetical protein
MYWAYGSWGRREVLDWLNQPSAADLPWMIGMLLVVRTFCWSWRERSRRKTMMAILDKEIALERRDPPRRLDPPDRAA